MFRRAFVLIGLVVPTAAQAQLTPVVTETGHISVSIDGLGTNAASGIIQVEKPPGATVRAVYVAAASTGISHRQLADGDVVIDGIPVAWERQVPCSSAVGCYSSWADITGALGPTIDAADPGRIDFTVTEVNTSGVEGEILVVIFDDPNQTVTNTVALMFGAQEVSGDQFVIALAEPLDKSNPNLALELSLGISYGHQGSSGGTGQVSHIDVNGTRMTTAAGGEDDGVLTTNGALLTVGGLDDTPDNPANPNAEPSSYTSPDDELYDLMPFVNDGDTTIIVDTLNPSNDDNIFFGSLFLRGTTAIVGEGLLLSPPEATLEATNEHRITAGVQDDLGNPIAGRPVTFEVLSGPHAGLSTMATTAADGTAVFAYTGASSGQDVVHATMVATNGDPVTSNEVTVTWTATEADLGLTLTGEATIEYGGGDLTYVITVTNHGPVPATGVTLSHTLPATVEILTVTPTQGSCLAGAAPGLVQCTLGALDFAAVASVDVVVRPTAVSTIGTEACVESVELDPDPTNDCDSAVTTVIAPEGADLQVTQTDSVDPVAGGEPLTYTIEVKNNGPGVATDVVLTDTITGAFQYEAVSAGGSPCDLNTDTARISCQLGDIGAGGTKTLVLTGRPQTRPQITSQACAETSEMDPVADNNCWTESTEVGEGLGVLRETYDCECNATAPTSPLMLLLAGTLLLRRPRRRSRAP